MSVTRIAAPFLLLFLFTGFAAAECTNCEIVIQDTYGSTRAVAESVDPTSIEFNLVDDATGGPANGVEVTLKNVKSGELLQVVAANGTAVFDGVEPGIWQVAANGVTFTDVGIGTSTAFVGGVGAAGGLGGIGGIGGLSATGTAIAATAAVGAGAVAVSASGSSSTDHPPLSPSK